MWLIIVILTTILAFVLFYLLNRSSNYWEKKGVTSIKPFPLIGNLTRTLFRRIAFPNLLLEFYNAFPDKRYIGISHFQSPILILRDLELIKRITVKEFNTFPEHKQFFPEDMDPLWNKNLFAMRGGQKWHDMRSTLTPSFTSSKIRMMFVLMKDCSKQLTNYFENQNVTGNEINMKDIFTRFTNDVIATTAFGINCDSLKHRENEFYLMGKDATNFEGLKGLKFLLCSVYPSFSKIFGIGMFSKTVDKFFRGIITETIQTREKNKIIRPDMIHLLMEARKGQLKDESSKVVDTGFAVVQETVREENTKQGKIVLTDEDITAQALMFFVAGFETASTFMCFTAYELAVNPEIQEKLRKEVDETLKSCKGDFTYEALIGMKYLDMVVSESLRKWPPNMATERDAIKPFTIEPELPGETPLTIDKGTNVWVPIFPIQRDPQYYPNPEKFDPERFSEENKHNIKPYTYLPFGAGPRSCIGSRFVLLEGKLVIADILRKFEIVPVEKTQIPLQFHKGNMNPSPEKGFWLGLKPRSK